MIGVRKFYEASNKSGSVQVQSKTLNSEQLSYTEYSFNGSIVIQGFGSKSRKS